MTDLLWLPALSASLSSAEEDDAAAGHGEQSFYMNINEASNAHFNADVLLLPAERLTELQKIGRTPNR